MSGMAGENFLSEIRSGERPDPLRSGRPAEVVGIESGILLEKGEGISLNFKENLQRITVFGSWWFSHSLMMADEREETSPDCEENMRL